MSQLVRKVEIKAEWCITFSKLLGDWEAEARPLEHGPLLLNDHPVMSETTGLSLRVSPLQGHECFLLRPSFLHSPTATPPNTRTHPWRAGSVPPSDLGPPWLYPRVWGFTRWDEKARTGG